MLDALQRTLGTAVEETAGTGHYCVQMDVRVPHGVDPAVFDRLEAEEEAQSPVLQREGKWRHLWRVAGQYATINVTPMAQHPSAIHTAQ